MDNGFYRDDGVLTRYFDGELASLHRDGEWRRTGEFGEFAAYLMPSEALTEAQKIAGAGMTREDLGKPLADKAG